MLAANIPSPFPLAWAANATAGYIRAGGIPTNPTPQLGAASLSLGLPPAVFQPVAAGGTYLFGEDLNAIFNELTAGLQWFQAGGQAIYDAGFSTAIGGYPAGAVLLSASLTHLWISQVDNNTSDPDTGGANWVMWTMATGYQYAVPLINGYGSNPCNGALVGDTPVTQFGKAVNQSGFWGVPLTSNVILSLPVKMLITYAGSAANNNFDLQLQYQNVVTGGLTPAYTTVTDILTAPSSVGAVSNYTTATAVIPAGALSANGVINCILTRLATNGLDTNTGTLQIINITMVQ